MLVEPTRLRSYNVSLHEIEAAIKNANANSTAGSWQRTRRSPHPQPGYRGHLDDMQRESPQGKDRDEVRRRQTDGRGLPSGGPGRQDGLGSPHETRRCGVNGQPAVILSIQNNPMPIRSP